MKLIITIPAYNEEITIGKVIRGLPRQIPGVETVQIIVVDDGSRDNTVRVSREAGADLVVSHHNVGLATNFKIALEEALKNQADIIVNIDADGQYEPSEIYLLIKPILEGRADIVSGDRQVKKLAHMPFSKKYGNMLGSWVVRRLSGLPISDASSGFRAYSREAALKMNIISPHTYTHETIIQAGVKRLRMVEVPLLFGRRKEKEENRA